MSQLVYGKVGTQSYGSFSYELTELPQYLIDQGYVVVPSGFPPQTGPAGEHGAYYLQPDLTWKWQREYIVTILDTFLKYDEAAVTRKLIYIDDWGFQQELLPSHLGSPSIAQMNTEDTATLASSKLYTDTSVASTVAAAIASYDAARKPVTVVTDSSGNFTYSYSSRGYATSPVITTGVEASSGFVVNITAISATSVSGNVVKPRSVAVGLLPYEAAGAGTKVHLHILPA